MLYGPPGTGYTLGDRVTDYDGKSIWTLYSGIKRVNPFSLSNRDYSSGELISSPRD